MTTTLFRYFQDKQRSLSAATLADAAFESQLQLLTAELKQQCMNLDGVHRNFFCQEFGNQLQKEMVHSKSARHRRVLLALLKKIERIKYRAPS